ncbi:MAG: high frequency lysogenization protein HflD [Pseudoxanthomonas sp.]
MNDRIIALAGLVQAARQVRQIADTGQAETASLAVCIDSLFRFDADSTADVYGGVGNLRPGLTVLVDAWGGTAAGDASRSPAAKDPALLKLAYSILQLERRFSANTRLAEKVREGLLQIERQREHWGPTHPTVLARLGELYAGTLSTLRPRVIVHGNPVYLSQPTVVADIRALLLCGLRAAVLWRQMGGRQTDFLFRRGAMQRAARDLQRRG